MYYFAHFRSLSYLESSVSSYYKTWQFATSLRLQQQYSCDCRGEDLALLLAWGLLSTVANVDAGTESVGSRTDDMDPAAKEWMQQLGLLSVFPHVEINLFVFGCFEFLFAVLLGYARRREVLIFEKCHKMQQKLH